MTKRERREITIYLAGVFDGEGCIRVEQNGRGKDVGYYVGTPRLSVNMYCEEVIDLWIFQFGGTRIESWFKSGSQYGRHMRYTWMVNGKRALEVLRELYPYLIEKKKQAKVLLNWPYSRHKPTPVQVELQRRRIVEEVQALKPRNRPQDYLPEPVQH